MSLKAAMRSAVARAYDALDDIPEACSFSSRSNVTYDTSTGETDADVATLSLEAVFAQYDLAERQADPGLLPEDLKGIFQAEAFTTAPKLDDIVTRADNTTWTVVGLRTDPAGAVWLLQLRRAGVDA